MPSCARPLALRSDSAQGHVGSVRRRLRVPGGGYSAGSFGPWPFSTWREPWRRLRRRALLPFLRLVHLVGALACPLAAGAGAVPGGVQLVGNLRP